MGTRSNIRYSRVKTIFAVCESAGCDGGTRRSRTAWAKAQARALLIGVDAAKASQPADTREGVAAADNAAGVAKPRGRPRRPPPVPKDSAEQADGRARLLKMGTSCFRDMCSTIVPNYRSWARQPKQLLVETLMPHHERLAAVFVSVAADNPGTVHAPAALPPTVAWPLPLVAAPLPSPSLTRAQPSPPANQDHFCCL